jgi:hypothetical protein
MDQATLTDLQQKGMERAAVLFQTLEQTEPPFTPVDIFKTCCSMKCAEILTRCSTAFPDLLPDMVEVIGDFVSGTLESAETTGIKGKMSEATRVNDVIETHYPYDEVKLKDPIEATIRMHMFDGLILLASSKFNREEETKDDIEMLQMAMQGLLVMRIIASVREHIDSDEPTNEPN